MLEIEGDAALAAGAGERRQGEVLGALGREREAAFTRIGRVATCNVAAGGILDLDDVSSEPGENERAERAGERSSQVDDAYAGQRAGRRSFDVLRFNRHVFSLRLTV